MVFCLWEGTEDEGYWVCVSPNHIWFSFLLREREKKKLKEKELLWSLPKESLKKQIANILIRKRKP